MSKKNKMSVGDICIYSTRTAVYILSHPRSKVWSAMFVFQDKENAPLKAVICDVDPLQRAAIIKHGTLYRALHQKGENAGT